MIANRQRGLINLHVLATTLLAASLMVAYENALWYLPFFKVDRNVNLLPYLLCVVGGMVISARYLQPFTSRYHRLSWVDAAQLTTRQVVVTALIIFAFMFAFKDRDMSRLFLGTFLILTWGMLLFVNHGLPRFVSRLLFGRDRRIPTLFVGGIENLDKLRNWLASKEMLGVQPVGFVTERMGVQPDSIPPFLGALTDLPKMIDSRQVVQVIVLEIPRARADVQFILEACQDRGCRLLIYSNLADQLQLPLETVSEDGHQFYTLQGEPLEDPLNRILKRAFDIALALPIVAVALPPLCLWVWLMQRIEAPGRLFFSQERTGHGQRSFRVIKFRSMYEAKHGVLEEARQAKRGDERIYPFGEFLRSSSLDEFPQFWNVLKGEMSIVGPRPHLVTHDQQFSRLSKGYRTRFFVKPGITGLAQCNGLRGEITDSRLLDRRVELDLAYVTRWSVWLDIQIVAKTAWQVLFPPDTAY